MPATAETSSNTVSVATLGRATTTSAETSPSSITTPPIVGVPCLMRCVCGPSSRTNCPNFLLCRKRMKPAPSPTVTAKATAAASTTLNKGQLLLQPPGKLIEAHAPRTFDDHVITSSQLPFELFGGGGVFIEESIPVEGLCVPAGLVPDAGEQVHADLRRELSGLMVVRPSATAQLEHPAQDRDEPPALPLRPLRPVAQHSRNRGRGGVVRVVVNDYVVAQPVHLAPQPRPPQPPEATGALLRARAQRQRAPDRREHGLHQVRPKDRSFDLHRVLSAAVLHA